MGFEIFKPHKDLVEKQLNFILVEIVLALSQAIDHLESAKRIKQSYQIMQNFVLNGGKRLRPILVLLIAQAFGEKLKEELIEAALSVELVHNSTLVHDDIMDGDSWRRGKETTHIQCKNLYLPDSQSFPNFTDANTAKGVSEAIIIGNVLLSQGCLLLYNSKQKEADLALYDLIDTYIKINLGQILDNQPIDNFDAYLKMIELKTANLFACSARIGAYLGGQNSTVAEKIGQAVLPAGLAFQITDDLLDLDPIREDKQGSDIKKAKSNILSCTFNKLAQPKQKQEFNYYFGNTNLSPQELSRAISLLQKTGTIKEVEEIRDRFYQESIAQASSLKFPAQSEKLLKNFLTLLAIREI